MKPNTSIQKLKDKTFILNLTIEKKDIHSEYQKTLLLVQKDYETKGFRKGKVPLEIVKESISSEKIFEETASHIISRVYSEVLKENNLKPIIQPQIKFKNDQPDFDHDWDIEITSCELPEITLNEKYQNDIKKINTDKEIKDDNQKMDQIIKALIANATLELPQILIDSDLQSHLSGLVDQANQAGISVNQYLESQKQTLESYKENLKKRIIDEWTINLSINKIAKDNKIEVSEDEVKKVVTQNPSLSNNINMIYYLLTQQKVFDFLKK